MQNVHLERIGGQLHQIVSHYTGLLDDGTKVRKLYGTANFIVELLRYERCLLLFISMEKARLEWEYSMFRSSMRVGILKVENLRKGQG